MDTARHESGGQRGLNAALGDGVGAGALEGEEELPRAEILKRQIVGQLWPELGVLAPRMCAN